MEALVQEPENGGDRTCVVCDEPADYHEIDVRGHVAFYFGGTFRVEASVRNRLMVVFGREAAGSLTEGARQGMMSAPRPSYCVVCGSTLERRQIEERERAYCPACDELRYRNPKPTAGILVVDDELLLVKRSVPPSVGAWSVPAGYLEHDEDPETAAVRELEEETGLVTDQEAIELFDTAFVEHPDGSHVLVVIYRADRAHTTGEPVAGSDADGARFWSLDELDAAGEHVEPGYMQKFERAVE